MKRAREITVRLRIKSGSKDDTLVRLTPESLAAFSSVLSNAATDTDDATIDVVLKDEWEASIMADLLESGAALNDIYCASFHIFKDEPSISTKRLVDLYHTLDKYDMTWAMQAMHTRILKDIDVGLVRAQTVFAAYNEHPALARFLIGRNDNKIKGVIDDKQLKMLLDSSGVRCAVVLSGSGYVRDDNHRLEWYERYNGHYHVDILCKIPAEDEDNGYIPEGSTGILIRKYLQRARSKNIDAKWLRIVVKGVCSLKDSRDWLGIQDAVNREDDDEEDDEEDDDEDIYEPCEYGGGPEMTDYNDVCQLIVVKRFMDLASACESIEHSIRAVISSAGEEIYMSDGFQFKPWPYDVANRYEFAIVCGDCDRAVETAKVASRCVAWRCRCGSHNNVNRDHARLLATLATSNSDSD